MQCNGMWDHLNCWPPASLGEMVSQPCPEFSEGDIKRHIKSRHYQFHIALVDYLPGNPFVFKWKSANISHQMYIELLGNILEGYNYVR